MKYSLKRTDTADSLLNRMILNAADRFGTEKAFEVLDSIEEKVNLLQDTPYIGTGPKYMVLKRQGYRVLILDPTLVFYKADEAGKISGFFSTYDKTPDSSGDIILQPYSYYGYSNVWIVRQDAGITDITMTVKPPVTHL